MKKKLFFFLLILNLSLFSQTQKADLIFIDGDTIQGLGLITKNNKIKFKLSYVDKAEKWDFRIIKGITFYGFKEVREFEYIKVNKKQKPLLLEVKYRGKVNIYEDQFYTYDNMFGNDNFMKTLRENKTTYLKRDNEELARSFLGFNFRKNAKEYFKDCPEVVDIFNTKEYKKYTIEEIALEYNIFCSE
ncbi:hypothetical protein [Tenacibaculum geojense]|uniref:DUF4476 domain-containing protein n=1 Tax=Tenacibaculum geojense TaxID=915352 RepID=A0ABW3JMA8_9FLAO